MATRTNRTKSARDIRQQQRRIEARIQKEYQQLSPDQRGNARAAQLAKRFVKVGRTADRYSNNAKNTKAAIKAMNKGNSATEKAWARYTTQATRRQYMGLSNG